MSNILNLYKRKDSRYWWFKWEHAGQTYRGSTKTTTKADARQYAEIKVQEIRDSLIRKDIPEIPWEVAAGRWLEKKQHKRSAKDDRQRLARLGDEGLNGRMISEIDEDSLDLMLEKMRAIRAGGKVQGGPLSPATKNRYLTVLKSVLIQCERWGWLEDVPALPDKFPEKARTRFFSDDQAEALIKSLPIHLGKMAELTLEVGLRYSNVARMQWDWIDFSRKVVRVPGEFTKNSKDLDVPVNSRAIEVLKWAAQHRPGGARSIMRDDNKQVFWRQDHAGEWFEVKALHSETWARSLRRAKLDRNWRWHDLRHTWATRHVRAGTPLPMLKELGGWDTIEMVVRYSHASYDMHAKAAESICQLHRGTEQSHQGKSRSMVDVSPSPLPNYSVSFSVDSSLPIELGVP